jgi:hypothetical protein
MISFSPITYFAYFDDYYVSLKISCHINIILYPRGWNNPIYVENIWLMWQEYSSKILYCSQKFNAPLVLMCSHGSYVGLGFPILTIIILKLCSQTIKRFQNTHLFCNFLGYVNLLSHVVLCVVLLCFGLGFLSPKT